MTARIVVVGSLNMDLVVRTPRLPAPGETIIGGGAFQTLPGGKGANQAVAAARIGARVAMVGRVGEDDFGRALLQNLEREGVDHRFVKQDTEAATGVAFIVVDDEGQNSIVVASGANHRVAAADVDAAEELFAGADMLLLQLESPLEVVQRAAKLARQHGVTVVLNPAPAQPLPSELRAMIDVLVPNESETALLTGLPMESPQDAEDAAAHLRAQGVETVILTLGARGALLATAGGAQRIPGFTVTPVDTTAAGDAFVGGLAVALAERRPLAEAVRWGNAAGALATTRPGAQPSLPSRREVQSLLQTE